MIMIFGAGCLSRAVFGPHEFIVKIDAAPRLNADFSVIILLIVFPAPYLLEQVCHFLHNK